MKAFYLIFIVLIPALGFGFVFLTQNPDMSMGKYEPLFLPLVVFAAIGLFAALRSK